MLLGDVIDEFLDEHGFTNASATEEADLSTLKVRLKQVNDFYSCIKDFLGSSQVLEFRGFPVNRERMNTLQVSKSIDGVSDDIHHTAPDLCSGGHGNRRTRVHCFHATLETVGRIHRHAPHRVLANMLLNFNHKGSLTFSPANFQRVMDARKSILISCSIEVDIHNRTYNLGNITDIIHQKTLLKNLRQFTQYFPNKEKGKPF